MPMNKHIPGRRSFLQKSTLAALAAGFIPTLLTASNSGKYVEDGSSDGLTFLFQGDSITDGNRGRNNDPNHIMGHGYAFSVASRVGADFPQKHLQFYNRGISGNKITDLQERWQTDTLDLKPDVLSILVGINDVMASIFNWENKTTISEFESIYDDLLRQVKEQNPDILFVLGIPFVYKIGEREQKWEEWKSETEERAKVVQKLAKKYDAVLVDYSSVFDKAMQNTSPDYWIWDGIHPTVFGHELMAREWMKQVSERLAFLKKYERIF